MTEKITHLQDMKKLVENTKDKQELEKLYEQTKNRSTWKKEFQSELKTVFGKSAFDKKSFLDNVLKDRTNIALFQMTHKESGYTKAIDGVAGDNSQTKQLAEKIFDKAKAEFSKENIELAKKLKEKNKAIIAKIKTSDLIEKSVVESGDQGYKNIKNSIKEGLNSIGDFISSLDEKFVHGMNVLTGKMAKAPYVVSEFLKENEKSISDGIDTTEGYAKYVAYMGTIGRIMEPAVAGSKKISKEAKIMYAKFGKSQFEYKEADKVIADLEKQDIKFTTVDDFIVLESESGEKIKIKNKELLASK